MKWLLISIYLNLSILVDLLQHIHRIFSQPSLTTQAITQIDHDLSLCEIFSRKSILPRKYFTYFQQLYLFQCYVLNQISFKTVVQLLILILLRTWSETKVICDLFLSFFKLGTTSSYLHSAEEHQSPKAFCEVDSSLHVCVMFCAFHSWKQRNLK